MSQLNIVYGGYTDAGVKSQNQDAFGAQLPVDSVLEHKGAIAAIADGLSSSPKAQLASRTCIATFIEDYLATPDSWGVERAAAKIIQSLNSWCFAQGTPALEQIPNIVANGNMLTTFTALVMKSTHAHIFHVGDSRIYRSSGGNLELLTRDHKQSQGKNTFLTRAIGVDSHIDVDHHKLKMQQNDLFVLTTDGVHDFIDKKQLAHLISLSHINLETKSKAIVDAALANGSDDNVSCLCIKVSQLPLPDLDASYQQLTQLAIPPPMQIGNKIDNYQVVDVLFNGTRSALYKVQDVNTQEIYALKAPTASFVQDLIQLRGFNREQWIGQRIDHPNVMKILPREANGQFLYHVCEFIDGCTLRQWMVDNPKPSLEQVRQILKPITLALRQMQRLDMVHRDLKPENIMISNRGEIKLIDFGTVFVQGLDEIDSAIQNDRVLGSFNYVAPESLLFNQADHSSDIFSLGVIAYEMLSHTFPFKPFTYKDYQPKSIAEWQYIPLHQTQRRLPLWVDLVLKKATSANPVHRYDALSEFMMDLTRPNESFILAEKNAPLIEKNPLLFWKSLCALLIALNIYLLAK